MNFDRGKMAAAAVLAATLLVVSGVTGYGLSRAGTVGQPFADDGRLKVMTSFYPMYDFARKVGGDKIQVKDMVPAGTEPHDWEPAATDIRNLEDADVFVYNGADLEAVVKDTIERAFIEGRTTITTADLIRSIKDTKSISCTLKDKIASIQKTVEKIDIKPASLDDKKEKEPDPSQVYMKATKAKV